IAPHFPYFSPTTSIGEIQSHPRRSCTPTQSRTELNRFSLSHSRGPVMNRRNRRRFCAPIGSARLALERLEERDVPTVVGGLDPSFGGTGKLRLDLSGGDFGKAVAIDSVGRVVLAGYNNIGQGGRDFDIFRLNPDGSFDQSFGTGGL